ncbi:GNAT family N-acetyltransferase [Aestuariimicrobium soli]|uniref:GNAT family N-acetyltransferase n=1 Tax=Aestuariimicrobium soli TaxID=2035834 RepID=UPI003EBCF8CA
MMQRSATLDDVPAIARLDEQSFPTKERWSEQLWADELRADDRFVMVAVDSSEALIGVATFQLVDEVLDLLRVMVDARWRRMGVASDLLRAGILFATSHGCTRILLEVRDDNQMAITLYEGFGFEVIDTRKNYYGPGLDARVMQHEVAQ